MLRHSGWVIDLFAGPGGWDLAAHTLGLRPLGIEWDDAACATRAAAGLRTLQADVAALAPRDFAPCVGLIASPPCQAFSMAGKGEGRRALSVYLDAIARWREGETFDRATLDERCGDERAHLVLEPLRWASALRPRWVACEQVEPVLPVWEAMAMALRATGYQTWTGVLSAEQYGVPQTRRRAFLLASLDGPVGRPAATHQRYIAPRRAEEATESLFDAPEPERIVAPEDRHLRPWVSMAQALGWGMTERPGMTLAFGTDSGGASLDGGGSGARAALNGERDAGRWMLRSTHRAGATVRDQDEPAPTIIGGNDYGTRVWLRSGQSVAGEGRAERPADEPSLTVTGRVDLCQWVYDRPATTVAGDPRVHPPGHKVNADDLAAGRDSYDGRAGENAVRVSLANALALQSFPPDYPVQGTKTKQFEQVGNAVPPGLALAVLRTIPCCYSAGGAPDA